MSTIHERATERARDVAGNAGDRALADLQPLLSTRLVDAGGFSVTVGGLVGALAVVVVQRTLGHEGGHVARHRALHVHQVQFQPRRVAQLAAQRQQPLRQDAGRIILSSLCQSRPRARAAPMMRAAIGPTTAPRNSWLMTRTRNFHGRSCLGIAGFTLDAAANASPRSTSFSSPRS